MSTEIEFVPDPSATINRPGMAWSAGIAQPVLLDPSLLLNGVGGPTVDNIATLRAITGYYNEECATVLGLVTPMDGSGGHYIFDIVSMAVDDSATAVRPNDITAGSPGMWLKYS